MAIIDITIVVATHNRAAMLRKTLESLINQVTEGKFSYEVLVIDDGSTDDTAGVVREVAGEARSLAVSYVYKSAGGEGDARNRGVAEARGEWIAFCDDDQWAEPRWLAELYAAARESGVDIVDGPVVLDLPESSARTLGPKSRRVLGEKFLGPEPGPYTSKETMGAGSVLIRKSLFTAVGGFDITFRQGVDTDFFYRAEQGGFSAWYCPRAIMHHVIPEARVQPVYLKGSCLRTGVATARIQWKYEGALRLTLFNLWRVGVTMGRDVPLVAIAALGRDRQLLLDSYCSVWFSLGFIRGSLFLLFPKIFGQKDCFERLDLPFHN